MNEMAVTTWWIQMTSPPDAGTIKPLPRGCKVMPAHKPTRAFYLFLYTSVGRSYQWYNRMLCSHEELQQLLNNDKNSIWVLYYKGVPAGFAEFDLSVENETELVYFGLTREFTGKKLGFPFLHWCIQKAWERKINRFWLHTCNADHPAALGLYQKAGFKIYDQDTVMQQKPDPEEDPYLQLPW